MITAAAVEAAAIQLFGSPTVWNRGLTHSVKEAYRAEARSALQVAAPILMAQAWGEGCKAGWEQSGEGADWADLTANPYLTAPQ